MNRLPPRLIFAVLTATVALVKVAASPIHDEKYLSSYVTVWGNGELPSETYVLSSHTYSSATTPCPEGSSKPGNGNGNRWSLINLPSPLPSPAPSYPQLGNPGTVVLPPMLSTLMPILPSPPVNSVPVNPPVNPSIYSTVPIPPVLPTPPINSVPPNPPLYPTTGIPPILPTPPVNSVPENPPFYPSVHSTISILPVLHKPPNNSVQLNTPRYPNMTIPLSQHNLASTQMALVIPTSEPPQIATSQEYQPQIPTATPNTPLSQRNLPSTQMALMIPTSEPPQTATSQEYQPQIPTITPDFPHMTSSMGSS